MKSSDLGSLSDRELLAFARLFNDGHKGDEAAFGLTAAANTAFETDLNNFETDIDDYDTKSAAENAAVQKKSNTRKSVLQQLRQKIKLVRATLPKEDENLDKVGLDVYDSEPTAASAPDSEPTAWVDYAKLKHTIYFRDAAAPDSEAKPKGVKGAEIYRYIGTGAPTSESDYDFLTLDSASPYTAFYTMADAGKKVFYMLRWVSTADAKGAWSATVEATVNG